MTNKFRMVTYLSRGILTYNITWHFDHVVLQNHDKQKPLYPHYHSVYGHWTWQGGELPWEADSDMIFNQVILLDHVTIGKIYISTFTRLMATKFGIYTYFGKEVQRANASVVTDFLLLLQIAVGKCSRNKGCFSLK